MEKYYLFVFGVLYVILFGYNKFFLLKRKNVVKAEIKNYDKKAILKCRSFSSERKNSFHLTMSCEELTLFGDYFGDCKTGCLGGGSCIDICPEKAISIIKGKQLFIDEEKCSGCGLCTEICPRNVIKVISRDYKVIIECQNIAEPWVMRETCSNGCLDCRICMNKCPYNAIISENNHCYIDYEKCHNCGICSHLCPLGIIKDYVKRRPIASITPKCTGCGKCVEICPVNAIEKREDTGKFRVVQSNCIGCGLCLRNCEEEAIMFLGALGFNSK